MGELIHKDLSGNIIQAAQHVLYSLRPGLDEKVYENALVIELIDRGHKIDQQKRFPVYYKNQKVGELIPDLIVNDCVIVDAKVCSAFNEHHMAQMTGYLSITDLELALLLNFKTTKLDVKRVVRSTSVLSAYSAV